jgi:glycosyltransferase involved in cell wall biosynthesis
MYQQTDIGIFPNRCEGGNNMVMCEYMASGRTVIASDATGHADVITPDNAFPLTVYTPQVINDINGQPSAIWHEPSVDELIELLETAYLDRDSCIRKGSVATDDMRRLTWDDAALKFHTIGNNSQIHKSGI